MTKLLLIASLCLSTAAMAQVAPKSPDPKLTPGAVRVMSEEAVCRVKWGKDARHVTAAMKKQVCASYGIRAEDCTGTNYEIDHLISRELGGADNVKNLWPQPWGSSALTNGGRAITLVPGAHAKDRLENALHRQVCAGKMTLRQAQKAIASDWWATYVKMFGVSQ